MEEADQITKRLCREKVIAVVVFEREGELAPTMESLLEAGIAGIELALRSPYALAAVELVRRRYPQMLLGVGTIISAEQVERVKDLADFGVAPGMNRRVVEAAIQRGFPFYPGISTASELEAALEYKISLLKFFPAEPLGGLPYLQSLNTPYSHLGLRYMPLGGVNAGNLGAYLQSPMIAAVGGSWIAARKLIAARDWSAIRDRAQQAMRIAKECGELVG